MNVSRMAVIGIARLMKNHSLSHHAPLPANIVEPRGSTGIRTTMVNGGSGTPLENGTSAGPRTQTNNNMKSENTPSKTTIAKGETIELATRFGSLSRGRCWGKFYPGKTRVSGDFEWVGKKGATLYLTGAGHYVVGSSDGFSREARGEFTLTEENSNP